MDTMIGQTLGQYQIVEQIGKGGMATVKNILSEDLCIGGVHPPLLSQSGWW